MLLMVSCGWNRSFPCIKPFPIIDGLFEMRRENAMRSEKKQGSVVQWNVAESNEMKLFHNHYYKYSTRHTLCLASN
jgi:hypothetical protein